MASGEGWANLEVDLEILNNRGLSLGINKLTSGECDSKRRKGARTEETGVTNSAASTITLF